MFLHFFKLYFIFLFENVVLTKIYCFLVIYIVQLTPKTMVSKKFVFISPIFQIWHILADFHFG